MIPAGLSADVTVSDEGLAAVATGTGLAGYDAGRPWLVPGFVRKQDAATAAVASIEDAAECGERADALVSGELLPVLGVEVCRSFRVGDGGVPGDSLLDFPDDVLPDRRKHVRDHFVRRPDEGHGRQDHLVGDST